MRFYFFLLTGLLLSAELHAGTPVVAAPSVSEKMMKDMHPVTLGEFSAGIKILDLKDLDAALTTPMEEIVAAHTEATKAKPDGRFVVFIAFSGMQLDDDRRADVTYELHLISPSGKADIIPSVIKTGMKHRVLDRTHVFLASEKVQLDFDAKDEPGNYTVNALVKDNIGQKQIPLTASIELIKPEKEHAP